MTRTFMAIPVDDDIRMLCRKTQFDLKSGAVEAKWTEPENLHLTLFFFGEIEDSRIESIRTAMKGLEQDAFNITFKRVGYFKRDSRPTVVWVGIDENRELEALYQTGYKLFKNIVPLRKKNRFRPHLTLGRIKKVPSNWERIIKSVTWETIKMPVERVILYRSDLTPAGPVYSQIEAIKLKQKMDKEE